MSRASVYERGKLVSSMTLNHGMVINIRWAGLYISEIVDLEFSHTEPLEFTQMYCSSVGFG